MTTQARLLSIDEGARYLGISPRTARTWLAHSRLPAVRIGRRVLIDKEALDQLIHESLRKGTPRSLMSHGREPASTRQTRGK